MACRKLYAKKTELSQITELCFCLKFISRLDTMKSELDVYILNPPV